LLALAPASNKKQNNAVVVDRSAILDFEEREKREKEAGALARQAAREVQIDAMTDLEALRVALKESEKMKVGCRPSALAGYPIHPIHRAWHLL